MGNCVKMSWRFFFIFNPLMSLTVGQIFLSLVPLLPQQRKDVSCCVEGGKDGNTKTWDPQRKDTLSNKERLLPWTRTVRQEGHYNGYRQSERKDITMDRESQKGRLPPQIQNNAIADRLLPNNNAVTMDAKTKKAVTLDTVEEKDCFHRCRE